MVKVIKTVYSENGYRDEVRSYSDNDSDEVCSEDSYSDKDSDV